MGNSTRQPIRGSYGTRKVDDLGVAAQVLSGGNEHSSPGALFLSLNCLDKLCGDTVDRQRGVNCSEQSLGSIVVGQGPCLVCIGPQSCVERLLVVVCSYRFSIYTGLRRAPEYSVEQLVLVDLELQYAIQFVAVEDLVEALRLGNGTRKTV